jgi:hypothetical protein
MQIVNRFAVRLGPARIVPDGLHTSRPMTSAAIARSTASQVRSFRLDIFRFSLPSYGKLFSGNRAVGEFVAQHGEGDYMIGTVDRRVLLPYGGENRWRHGRIVAGSCRRTVNGVTKEGLLVMASHFQIGCGSR